MFGCWSKPARLSPAIRKPPPFRHFAISSSPHESRELRVLSLRRKNCCQCLQGWQLRICLGTSWKSQGYPVGSSHKELPMGKIHDFLCHDYWWFILMLGHNIYIYTFMILCYWTMFNKQILKPSILGSWSDSLAHREESHRPWTLRDLTNFCFLEASLPAWHNQALRPSWRDALYLTC